MAQEKKSVLRRIHDATCLGAVFKIRPLQQICPICRADLKQAESKSAS